MARQLLGHKGPLPDQRDHDTNGQTKEAITYKQLGPDLAVTCLHSAALAAHSP